MSVPPSIGDCRSRAEGSYKVPGFLLVGSNLRRGFNSKWPIARKAIALH